MQIYQFKIKLSVRCQATLSPAPKKQSTVAKAQTPQIPTRKEFKRQNPFTDKFDMNKFHHVEFWCNDATNTYKRFQIGLGMQLTAKSDLSTKNNQYASYILEAGEAKFIMSAPYSDQELQIVKEQDTSIPSSFNSQKEMNTYLSKHGIAVKAIGVEVACAQTAHDIAVRNGAKSLLTPQRCADPKTERYTDISEVIYYGDVALRFISGNFQGPYLPLYKQVNGRKWNYGIDTMDHVVGNVYSMSQTVQYIKSITGLHEFAEFCADEVGTSNSGLNSTALASNNEYVITPVNEPTYGTKRKSQIQTFLEQHRGEGVQHIALKTNDIFQTLDKMSQYSEIGGFEFQNPPLYTYYKNLPNKIGSSLTPEQYEKVQQYGVLVDKDDQGTLLQIFTKPVGDRPTFFFEIIQRVGCYIESQDANGAPLVKQKGGCGGFGKGNFSDLFKSIEEYEKTLQI